MRGAERGSQVEVGPFWMRMAPSAMRVNFQLVTPWASRKSPSKRDTPLTMAKRGSAREMVVTVKTPGFGVGTGMAAMRRAGAIRPAGLTE